MLMEKKNETKIPRWNYWICWLGPVAVWVIVLFWSGAEAARYETSWRWLEGILRLLCPEHAPPESPNVQVNVSMYQLNGAVRRVAHIFGYGVLAGLLIRAIQQGNPRLKPQSLLAAVGLGLLFTAVDEVHRLIQENRHAKWQDVVLNLVGMVLVVVWSVLYFAFKSWEQRVLIGGDSASSEMQGVSSESDNSDNGIMAENNSPPTS
jgi:VanZ family protein